MNDGCCVDVGESVLAPFLVFSEFN
jgi:hypothetical protein